MDKSAIFLGFFIVFLVFMVVSAVVAGMKNKQGNTGATTEYFLGGKNIPVIVLAMSYCASAVSAGSFIGDPGYMSTIGWPYYWFTIFTIGGLVIPGLFIMRKLRLQSERYGCLTITQYIGDRFNSKWIKVYISAVMVLCYLFMMVSQFKGAAVLLETYTGVNFNIGLIVMAVVVAFFVNYGGLRSVAWTDFFMGCFMVILSLSLVVVCFSHVGWYGGLHAGLEATHPDYNVIYQTGAGATFPWYSIPCIFLFSFLVMFSQPYITARYIAMPNISRKSVGTFLIISLITGLLFNTMVQLGLVGAVLFPEADPDYLTVTMSVEFFPTVIAGVAMIGFFSAMLSTASSILLVCSQAIGQDIYGQVKKNADEKSILRVTQISTVVIIIGIVFFNIYKTPDLLQVFVLLSLAGVGSMLCAPTFLGVLWPKARREGAWCAVISGPLSYFLMDTILGWPFPIAMGLCAVPPFVLMWVVSVALNKTKGEDAEMVRMATIDPDTYFAES